MTSQQILKYTTPLLSVLVVFLFTQFLNSLQDADNKKDWFADIQYTHIALTQNIAQGNGSVLEPKSYLLDPKGGANTQTLDGLAEARFPWAHALIARLAGQDSAQQANYWKVGSSVFFLVAVFLSGLLISEFTDRKLLIVLASIGANLTAIALLSESIIGPYTLTYALIIGGFYFSIKYLKSNSLGTLILSLLFLGTATLQGHGTILFLVGSFFCFGYRQWVRTKQILHLMVSGAILGLFLSLFYYNHVHLFAQNGGLFEIDSLFGGHDLNFWEANSAFLSNLSSGVSNLFIGVTIFFGFLVRLIQLYNKETTPNQQKIFQGYLLVIVLLQLAYYLLYVSGLVGKDLFFIENMTPTLVLISLYFVTLIFNYLSLKKNLALTLMTVLVLGTGFATLKPYQNKLIKTDEDRVQMTLKNLTGAHAFLDSVGIPREAKISLINGYGGNMALMKCERKGYVADGASQQDYQRLLDYQDSDYVLSQDEFFMFDVVNAYPEILGKLELKASNETMTLYQKKKTPSKTTGRLLKDFVLCHQTQNYLEVTQDFEDLLDDSVGTWNMHGSVMTLPEFGRNQFISISQQEQFPCTNTIQINKDLKKVPKAVVVTAKFFTKEELKKVCFNVSCHDPNEGQYFVEIFKVSKKLKGDALSQWTSVSCKIALPENLKLEDEIKVYLWNPLEGELLMDDFSFVFY